MGPEAKAGPEEMSHLGSRKAVPGWGEEIRRRDPPCQWAHRDHRLARSPAECDPTHESLCYRVLTLAPVCRVQTDNKGVWGPGPGVCDLKTRPCPGCRPRAISQGRRAATCPATGSVQRQVVRTCDRGSCCPQPAGREHGAHTRSREDTGKHAKKPEDARRPCQSVL